MVQGYGNQQGKNRSTPYRMRQDLGYVPARAMADGDGGGGITSEGGPSGPLLTLTPIAQGMFLGNLLPGTNIPIPTPYTFIGLTDVPAAYTSAALKLVRVNAGATALEFITLSAELDTISSTRGSVLYRGATGWVALAPSTSGFSLQTQGAGANPVWAAVAAGNLTGDVTSVGLATTLSVSGVTAGSYTNANITVDAKGRVTAAASGAASAPYIPLSSGDLVAPALVFGNGMAISVPLTSAKLDTRIIAYFGVGLASARPVTPSITTGGSSCYLASDTGKFFVWTGSAWAQTN